MELPIPLNVPAETVQIVSELESAGFEAWCVGGALRDALLPVISLLGLALPFLLTGAVLVETVFAWPGLGKLAADAILARDYPLVLGTVLLASLAVVVGSLVADLLTVAADPRIRLSG